MAAARSLKTLSSAVTSRGPWTPDWMWAYTFSSQGHHGPGGPEEAQFLLQLLEKFSAFDGPVVFDWENIDYDTARTDGVDSNTITAAANAFCQEVEQAGYQP